MTFAPASDAALPQAYEGCMCSCHRIPGVLHVMACCWPGKGKLQYEKNQKLPTQGRCGS